MQTEPPPLSATNSIRGGTCVVDRSLWSFPITPVTDLTCPECGDPSDTLALLQRHIQTHFSPPTDIVFTLDSSLDCLDCTHTVGIGTGHSSTHGEGTHKNRALVVRAVGAGGQGQGLVRLLPNGARPSIPKNGSEVLTRNRMSRGRTGPPAS